MKTKNDTINAIQTMVDSAVSKAGYDKTRNAMVIARNSNNTYEIEMDSIRYSNVVLYGSGALQTNEIVKVVIPNNQASQMYILGKGVIEGRRQGSVNGLGSNAFGQNTVASGSASHAEGRETIASSEASHAQGKYNVANNSHADIVGNGTDADHRSNAYALDWDGNGYYKGDVYVGCNDDSTGGEKVLTASSLTVEYKSTSGKTIDGNTAESFSIDVAKTGYTPLGIVGRYIGYARFSFIRERIISGNTASITVRNITSSSYSTGIVGVYVLYVKN